MTHVHWIALAALVAVGCAEKEAAAPAGGEGPRTEHGLVMLGAVDFAGGDLKHQKTPDGPAACAKACADDAECRAFTYAKPDHPNARKHHSCWLKKAGFRYKRAEPYVSGIKP